MNTGAAPTLPGMYWQPGPAQPYGRLDEVGLARFFAVPTERIRTWRERGMPSDPDGCSDAFAACNWVGWEALVEAPLLARRWRWYAAWFGAWVAGEPGLGRVLWRRRHGVVLPQQGTWDFAWLVPDPSSQEEVQQVLALTALDCPGAAVAVHAGMQELRGSAEAPVATGLAALELRCLRQDVPSSERAALTGLMEELVAGFRYGYRRHVPEDCWSEQEGSCLDLTMACGARCAAAGRPWRLCAGLVASTRLANPHYWLEVGSLGGAWVVLDPSLPAIARMLGLPWRTWVTAYVGGHDGRRILLARGDPADRSWKAPLGAVSRGFVSPAPGALLLRQGHHSWRDAFRCLDWVCGEAYADITAVGPGQLGSGFNTDRGGIETASQHV